MSVLCGQRTSIRVEGTTLTARLYEDGGGGCQEEEIVVVVAELQLMEVWVDRMGDQIEFSQ